MGTPDAAPGRDAAAPEPDAAPVPEPDAAPIRDAAPVRDAPPEPDAPPIRDAAPEPDAPPPPDPRIDEPDDEPDDGPDDEPDTRIAVDLDGAEPWPEDEATLYFATNRATLGGRSRKVLRQIAARLVREPTTIIVVEGHSSNQGPDELNRRLARRRATRAADFLAALGVSRDRMNVDSFGDDRPVTTGDTEEAHQKNRRVELRLEKR